MKRSIVEWAVVAGFLALSACGDSDSTGPAQREVASITITPETPQVVVGSTTQLSATLYDQNGSAFTAPPAGVVVAWSSASPTIAGVSQAGVVEGIGPGTARITAAAAGRTAFVDVTVSAANLPPVAQDDSASVVQGSSVAINVIENDSDADGDDLTAAVLTDPAHGTAEADGDLITYTPDADYVGADQFDYTINDGNGGIDTATVFIDVAPAEYSETQHSVGMSTLEYNDGMFYNVFHDGSAGDSDVYLRTSDDGVVWSEKVRASDGQDGTEQHTGSIAVWGAGASARVAILYEDRSTANPQLRVAVSQDGGATFDASVPVSSHADNNAIRGNIAVDEAGVLYAAWTRQYSGDRWDYIWFSTSTDDGATWSPQRQIFNSGHYGSDVHVEAGAAGAVWVVVAADTYYKTDVRVLRSTDGGGNWTMQSVTNHTQADEVGAHPSMLHASNGSLYVTWQNTPDRRSQAMRVQMSRSTDGGATWTAPVLVSDSVPLGVNFNTYNSRVRPSLAEGVDGTIHIVWADDREGPAVELDARNYDVYISSSADGGATWSVDRRVNDMAGIHEQAFASVAAGPQGVLVVWRDQRLAPWYRLHARLNP